MIPTLVIGASTKPWRYSFMAIKRLVEKGVEVKAIGSRPGEVFGVTIDIGFPEYRDIHTVSLYLSPKHQQSYKTYLKQLKPSRVIFNPGTENEALENDLAASGIEVIRACTLVLLSTNQYEP